MTNWAAYDIALRQRGSLTVWFTEATIAAWKAEPRAKDALRKSGSQETPRWRKTDSNPRSPVREPVGYSAARQTIGRTEAAEMGYSSRPQLLPARPRNEPIYVRRGCRTAMDKKSGRRFKTI